MGLCVRVYCARDDTVIVLHVEDNFLIRSSQRREFSQKPVISWAADRESAEM